MTVVDSSVLIDFLRKKDTAGSVKLRQMIHDKEPYSVPVVCCLEILQGARTDGEWDSLIEHFSRQTLLSSQDQWQTSRDAARIFFDCRRRGITIRSSIDCMIAQLVLDADGSLLHNDEDFEHIAKVRPLRQFRC